MKQKTTQPQASKAKETFKRYHEYRNVKVNSDRIDFDLKCEDVEALIKRYENFYNGIDSF